MFNNKALRCGLALTLGAAMFSWAMAAAATPEFKVRGRFNLDYGIHDNDNIDLDDGFLMRRTRIGLQGTINEDWSGIIEYDFAENNTNAQDIILRRKWQGGTIKIGNFKVPMGMEEVASTNNIPFLERASSNTALVDARRLGIGYDWYGDTMGFQGMVYGRGLGSNQDGDDPIGIAGRFIYAPKMGGNQLHLAASVAYEDVRDYDVRRYRDRPEARADGNRLIDTGNISDVDSTLKLGLEAAYQAGPFNMVAEYFNVDVDRNTGEEPSFSGYYIQGVWVVTGEKRGYRDGIFRGLTPASAQRGAWELALRYSTIDLNDAGFQGGEQETVTFGVNYYPNANVRFMLNYIMVDVDDSGATVGGNVVGDESPNILIMRAQYHF
ncbi:MAG: OprO/OprP family phosphate-selective porin [Gammaproteobacteria bacterium]